MRPAYFALVLLIWLASRCSHTETVNRQDQPAAQEDQADATGKAGKKPERDRDDRGQARKRDDGEHEHDASSSTAEPPLATSPAGLLQPRAVESLQDKLIARGYLEQSSRSGKLDGATKRALRDFQREQGLPATGTPDDLTVRKLGLSPGDIFRSTTDSKP